MLLRSSGFGQTGPYTARAAFNPVGLAFGGITYLNGWPDRPPLRDGVMSGDYTTALFNVLGMLAALLRRDVDGQGQVVDTAMFEAALRLTGDLLPARTALGIRRERAGGDWPLYPASVTVEAADGRFVAVSAASAAQPRGRARGGWAGAQARTRRARGRSWRSSVGRSPPTRRWRAAPWRRAGRERGQLGGGSASASRICWSRGDLVRLPHPELGEIVTQGIVPRCPARRAGWPAGPRGPAPTTRRSCASCWATRRSRSGSSTGPAARARYPARITGDSPRRAHVSRRRPGSAATARGGMLPLGAVEQHGPHLPLLVDWLGAEELARRVAPHLERAGYRVILAPALPYGASPLAAPWPGTVSLSTRARSDA